MFGYFVFPEQFGVVLWEINNPEEIR